MDSETSSTLNNNIKNHLPVQSNGLRSAPDPPKQPFVIDFQFPDAENASVKVWLEDSFYHSLSDDTLTQVYDYNFDHPDAFNTELLLSCMEKLKNGRAVNIPNYDFQNHKRIGPGWEVNPSDIIILEGILVLHDPRVRDLMNMKIFVDTDSDLRLARRIQRDTVERGRNIQNVLDQFQLNIDKYFQLWNYYSTNLSNMVFRYSSFQPVIYNLQYARSVKPSFEEFILPSKKYADVIIPRGGDNDVAIDLIIQHIRAKLGQHHLCKIYPNVSVIHSTFQMRGMHTLVRDVKTTKHDFVFYADRLIRLVVEHGLGHLPFTEKQITTPTGSVYPGVVFCKRLCGVSVIRSGESMENALRACCKGIKIGKILIHGEGNNGRQLIYEKLPADISSRHVLLLDPVLASGNSAVKAINLLLSKGVVESNIIFLNLIAAPQGIHVVCKKFPKLKIVTSEIDATLDVDLRVIPGMGEFGDRYFGTNNEA
ncbi:hypothetical protein H0E87_028292 [Populus deltoides]|uniref:uridine/cytidine kinase n=1 Tax=Populus deltoides TaxID=3696 RepID=A0A8T2WRA5_POPDE|nr:hypothetical protein H0E87_028292 [Populus deltoides]